MMHRSEALIDLAAITANVATLKASTKAQVMAVVKADGYGHGLVPSARAALAGGASWLGVAMIEEALALRSDGITAPILAWLWTPQDAGLLRQALAADIDISVASLGELELVVLSAAELGQQARIHLKIDTGLSRNGATPADWPDLVGAAGKAAANGVIINAGMWSHFACADTPGHPTIAQQSTRFATAVSEAERLGVIAELRHIANSAAILTLPESHFDLVRAGIAMYGLSPVPQLGDFGLVPAMTLKSHLVIVKRLAAGAGVSYGHRYHTDSATTVALVPLGYADGIPRAATNLAPVQIAGRRYRVSGQVCMDQFVVDVGDLDVAEGDEVVLFGSGRDAEPTAQEWATALNTIHYEIVTRIGSRVPRTYQGLDALTASASGS